jgi:hypothetical protein
VTIPGVDHGSPYCQDIVVLVIIATVLIVSYGN